jgi:hypothetical protein
MRYANDGLRFALELAAFSAGVVALWAADAQAFAVILGALVVAHLALTFVLGQRPEPAR